MDPKQFANLAMDWIGAVGFSLFSLAVMVRVVGGVWRWAIRAVWTGKEEDDE